MAVPDITERLPVALSERVASSEQTPDDALYDVTIGGLGFVMDITSQTPYQRATVPLQKQQVDTSTEAGEQTLEGMWVRSQTSWHLGAGATFYEPSSKDGTPSRHRYTLSRGIDIWTPGQLTLLPDMEKVREATSSQSVVVCGSRLASGEDVYWSRVEGVLMRHHVGGPTTQATKTSLSGRMTAAGGYVLSGATDGVWRIPLEGTAFAQVASATGSVACEPWWVKSRVIVSRGGSLYSVPLGANTALDASSLIYSHPDSDWRWTGVTETPDSILAAGYSAGSSGVFAFTLVEDGAGSVPKLSQAFQVAELPPGEQVRAFMSYLGKYVGIGTTKGIRVGVVGDRGALQYGPVLVETPDPVNHVAARESFMYAATVGSVIRVNLAEPIDGLRFPYAYDVEIASNISSIAFNGSSSTVVLGSDGVGVYGAAVFAKRAIGWLASGAIRYGTTIPKSFRTADVDALTPSGTSVAMACQFDDDGAVTAYTLTNGDPGKGIGIGSLKPQAGMMRYVLVLNGGATGTPTVRAVDVRAIPVPHRQRLIQYPLRIADTVRDRTGVAVGYEGYAAESLAALEALEETKATVMVNDATRPETYEATIEKVEFTRVEPAARSGAGNFGGLALVTVRTL